MSQSKTEFHIEKILEFVEKMRDIQDRKGSGLLANEIDWIEFHAKQIDSKCKECADSPNGSKNET